jgi:serine/threonine protein kinase
MDETKALGPTNNGNPIASGETVDQTKVFKGNSPLPPKDNEIEIGFKEVTPGDMVDGYRVDKLIGKGGMGRVYKVTDPMTGKKAALKTLSLDTEMSEQDREMFISRFTNEAQIMWKLFDQRVPYVPHIFHMPKNPLGIIMELLPGSNIEEYLEQKDSNLPHSQKINLLIPLMAKVAIALNHAHKLGIIHRDLKPANIIIQEGIEGGNELTPILVDFGISKNPERQLTTTQSVMGTPSFMSPEQLMGKTSQVDGKSDIFSFGMVLFNIITNSKFYGGLLVSRAPFFERIMAQIALLENMGSSEGKANEKLLLLPSGYREIVTKCLAFNPEDRYSSMGDVEKALQSIDLSNTEETLGDPTLAEPQITTNKEIRKPANKKSPSPISPLIAGGTITAIVIVAGLFLLMGGVFSKKKQKYTSNNDSKQISHKEKQTEKLPPPKPSQRFFCKKGSIDKQASCLLALKDLNKKDVFQLVNTAASLLETGCGTDSPKLASSRCYQLGMWSSFLFRDKCKGKGNTSAQCMVNLLDKTVTSSVSKYWIMLSITLRSCHRKLPAKHKSSNIECRKMEKEMGLMGPKIYKVVSILHGKKCLSKRKKHYTENPAALMACIKNRIKNQKLIKEMEFTLLQSNYWHFCKTGSRHNRANKKACRSEIKNVQRQRSALSSNRSKSIVEIL